MSAVISIETKRLLQLSFLPGIGTVALRRILSAVQRTGLDSIGQSQDVIRQFGRGNDQLGKQNADGWHHVIERSDKEGVRILSPLDADYPLPLTHIDDFPPVIYVKGNVACLKMPSCAVVGTREASRLGLSWARQIAEIFANEGYCIVSGLALGIDTAAHEGALRANGRTVAVLAHGLDKVTPASNKALGQRILDEGGAWVSEHPPGTPPRRAEYVRRNRIQSGMSLCSVVVESGEEGGAIHQGNFTTKQGRLLLSVRPSQSTPGSSDFNYGGVTRLARDAKARVIEAREDLLDILQSGTLIAQFERLTLGGNK